MTGRFDRVRQIMEEGGLDGVIISNPANRFYLSGFTADDHGPDESSGIMLIGVPDATLYTGSTNLPWAESEARDCTVAAWKPPWEAFLGGTIAKSGAKRVGFEDAALTVASLDALTAAAGSGVTFIALGHAIDQLRAIKDEAEIAALAAAIHLTDEIFVTATANLQPGITERQLAWKIESEMRERGAEGPAFPTSGAAGPHGARPHHSATDRPIAAGEPVVIDMGARLAGYAGDLTRTIWIGEPSSRLQAVYTIVDTAQRAALAAIRAGMTGQEADAVARDEITTSGYGDAFVHGLGHGLGIRVHESPSLGRVSSDRLQPGHVVTVEPGIYLPDWGGVRIEDVAVVEEQGLRVLTGAPKVAP